MQQCSPFWHLAANRIPIDNHRPFSPMPICIFPIFAVTVDQWSLVSKQQLRQLFDTLPQYLIVWLYYSGYYCQTIPPHLNFVCGIAPAIERNSNLQ